MLPSARVGVVPFSGGVRQLEMEPPSTGVRVSVTPRWRFSLEPYSPSTLLSDAWLVQGMTMSHGIVNSLPGIGSGERRPLASGAPRRTRWKTMPLTLPPSSVTTSTGEAKNSNCTPSKRVSCCSSSSTTISSGPRR